MTLGSSTGVSDTGRRRRRNEDAYVCEPPLFAVADGMGGPRAGEIASRLAAAALREEAGHGSGVERVAALIQEANRRVYQRQSEDPDVSGMGTTMTVALVEDDRVAFGHVGDSRAYVIRDGRLEQLTEDHSLVGELLRSGKLSPEEAASHPQRSVITRALGTDPDVDVDTFAVETRAGDVYLLCSDGLTSMLDDEEILATVERHRESLELAARALIKEANRSGGEDNITVVFFEISGRADELEETARLVPTADPETEPADDEEDTLSGIEAVPAVDTMVVPPEEAERFAVPPAGSPERPSEAQGSAVRRFLPLLLLLAGVVVVLALLWVLTR